MSQLMLVNPSKKRKRRASPKQLAALRKARAARKGASRRKPTALASVRRRGKPASRRTFHAAGFKRNPTRRKYKRNPDKFSMQGFIKNSLTPSALGAGGALGLDIVLGMLPLPAMLKTDTMRPIVRVAGAIGIGMIGSMVAGRRMGESIGSGALTVVLYDELKKFVTKMAPTLKLGDEYPTMEYVNPAQIAGEDDMGQYVGQYVEGVATSADDDMGVYVV